MPIQIGDTVYDPVNKKVGMVTDVVKTGGWRIEWSDDTIAYMWNHEAEHFKTRWEWLKVDVANGYV